MPSPVSRFLSAASAEEKAQIAREAATSVGQLYQLAGGHRNCGPKLARRIELAANKAREKNRKLPPLRRTDLCEACAGCEFAKRCAG